MLWLCKSDSSALHWTLIECFDQRSISDCDTSTLKVIITEQSAIDSLSIIIFIIICSNLYVRRPSIIIIIKALMRLLWEYNGFTIVPYMSTKYKAPNWNYTSKLSGLSVSTNPHVLKLACDCCATLKIGNYISAIVAFRQLCSWYCTFRLVVVHDGFLIGSLYEHLMIGGRLPCNYLRNLLSTVKPTLTLIPTNIIIALILIPTAVHKANILAFLVN